MNERFRRLCRGNHTLGQAQQSILVQAYSFTSTPIAEALVKAHARGVDVQVILDKSQVNYKYSVYPRLLKATIPVFVDSKPAIAHNKIMIIDGHTTLTSSFNFTAAAQKRNAENVMVVHDASISAAYRRNWENRLAQSVAYPVYVAHRAKLQHARR